MLELFLMSFGAGFVVLKVVRIDNAVWVKTPYRLVHGYECFGGAFWVYLHRPSRWRQYVLTESWVPNIRTTWSHNAEDCNFES
jgi:hypothetical protein